VDAGLGFFDTAEIYGNGTSERILGGCVKRDGRPVLIASKFAPPSKMNPMTPKRRTVAANSPHALLEALDDSLGRLGVDHIDLYQMHTPPSKNTIADYMEVMAEAVAAGKVRAVGVCNFSADQIRQAHRALAEHGLGLATAMVGYNLLRRWPETNGTFEACRELGVSVIPYAPLAEGVLTGKYRGKDRRMPLGYKAVLAFGHLNITKDHSDSRSFVRRLFSKPVELDAKRLEPLFKAMDAVAAAREKTLAQIAVNWLLTNPEVSIIPIPGMKTKRQVVDNVGALGWAMTGQERQLIDTAITMSG
jgi:aryl-alcohol dehydrogenase-like predicted oxidoreductase